MVLYGRSAEKAEIESLLAAATAGRGAALVIRGDAGIGKSALLDYAVRSAAGMRVLCARGVDSESGLPYSALHLLLRPAWGGIDALPEPQASALRSAFGLAGTMMPDPRLVGYATLTLLSRLAAERPLLCVIDDARELDRPSVDALVLAARRLYAEGVAMIFAAGEGWRGFSAGCLRELRLQGLAPDAARETLTDRLDDMSVHTVERIVEESAGNPLALAELAAALTPRQRAGQLPSEVLGLGALPVRRAAHAASSARISSLPASTRTLLNVVAADGRGDMAVALRAAAHVGASIDDLALAERAQLIHVAGNRLSFRQPLLRQAAYHDGTVTTRVRVHTALATAFEDIGDRAASAWHRAAAATCPDEKLARDLESVAEHARLQGACTQVVSAYQRAAELSADRQARGRRLAAAAFSAATSGDIRRADAFADDALSLTEDVRCLARLAAIRAGAEAERGSLRDAAWILMQGAMVVADHVPDLSATMLMDAAQHAWFCDYREAVNLAASKVAGLRPSTAVRVGMAGVQGIAGLLDNDVPRGLESFRDMVEAARDGRSELPPELRLHATEAALFLGDDCAARDLGMKLAASCRAHGRFDLLPAVLNLLARAQLFLGFHHEARASGTQALEMARNAGNSPLIGQINATLSRIAAIEGDEATCWAMTAGHLTEGVMHAEGWAVASRALLELGLGRGDAAANRLGAGAAGSARHCVMGSALLPDAVEAGMRAGRPDLAQRALGQFTEYARHAGQAWAKAVALRCAAAMEPDGAADELYAESVLLHQEGAQRPFERARTELAYGEWLRRHRRRTDARTQLRSALEIFDRLGATPWADRAQVALRAAGESAPQAPDGWVSALSSLTTQERHVARLAAAGLSNQDIAVQLCISPRTVGYHLYKAYPKLGVTRRIELARFRFAESA
ncbi:helix-turn-helix transcriptional regulator [Phytoactinopolyspora endophytica]|uniref:helix-turn-helix transcriptional regulator n=1 Tax=Phytoactinopolyspora endophytica TaxID=1642495 RepID=UPI00101C1B00|nr:LuxR family transcriptional regulator [Phytoactinopolyspora endophytica]